MPDKFVIRGGKPLKGEIEVRGAKNAAFPILAATLLTKESCQISNVPLIEDVFRMIEILEGMGAEISWQQKRTLLIKNTAIDPSKMRTDLVTMLRGSVLFLGPLLSRFGKINLPPPGGCIIGARPIDTHLDGFSQIGVNVQKNRDRYLMEIKEKRGGEVILNEFSVTATENLMLYASLIPQKIVIKNADQDYQVQELAKFLTKMGAKIKIAGANTVEIFGSKKLKGVKHNLIYDPIEAGTFIITAVATKSEVLVKNVETPFLELELKRLKDFGVPLKLINKNSLKVFPWKSLRIDKIQSLPYPGIHSDLLSAFGVLSTQSEGSTLIHDPLYEGRLKYLEELNKMGAEIIICDPHRAIINGPTQLQGAELGPLDLRGGAALIIAGLIAKGTTTINGIYQIDRGYEKIEERLQGLGANIERVKE